MHCPRILISYFDHNRRRRCISTQSVKGNQCIVVLSLILFFGIANNAHAAAFFNIQRYLQDNRSVLFIEDDDEVDDARHDKNATENNQDNLSNQPTPTPSVNPSTLPSLLPSKSPSVLPSVAPTYIPTLQPYLFPSVRPSAIPSLYPSITPSTVPSSVPSIDCSVGPIDGEESNTPINVQFEYEIIFNSDNSTTIPPVEYLELVILPYMREVFAKSFVTSPPYCGEECMMRRPKLRAENLSSTRRMSEILSKEYLAHERFKKSSRLLQSNNTLDEVDFFFEAIEGVIGVGLGPLYDEINLDQPCFNNETLETSGPCVRINGDLDIYVADDANIVELQGRLEQRLFQAMEEDWYVCDDNNLNISKVLRVQDLGVLNEPVGSTTLGLDPTKGNSNFDANLAYGLAGGGALIGLLAMSLLFARQKKESLLEEIISP
mmetsp:Transcript_25824/g.29755  ORF Transcript_25824/g.29755 Transcript_25824/m.29755 type:complete len:433 (-) Transcript_25824:377-1675(-)|eukprot:CAMPEP_0194387938 /NCGR_PEP_ID=MMETSP0174-20130528/95317_1 /TAXON_ID=216777 /ORGANISM="Proboscia alata, Strain PI-D3" /LENGTH=432 /DNA_ID=CAMNT_0039178661 /DNA_START=14 /DNA_END=1312 /DNA_ORIENTATION=+